MKLLNKTQTIGLFVIIIIIATYALIRFLKAENIFGEKSRYYASIDDVTGIAATVPVDIKGLKVGTIEKIDFNGADRGFILTLRLKSEYRIPKDSYLEKYTANLLGNMGLRIVLGNSDEFLHPSDTLRCITVPDMISEIGGKIGPISQQLQVLLTECSRMVGSLNEIMDDERKEDLRISLDKLRSSMTKLDELSGTLSSKSPQISGLIDNLNNISGTLSNNSQLMDSTLADAHKFVHSLSEANIEQTVEQLRLLAIKLQDPNGSIGKLMTTDELHNSVDSLVNSINGFIKKVEANPKKFIKISVF